MEIEVARIRALTLPAVQNLRFIATVEIEVDRIRALTLFIFVVSFLNDFKVEIEVARIRALTQALRVCQNRSPVKRGNRGSPDKGINT